MHSLSFDKDFIDKRAKQLDAEDRNNHGFIKGMQYGGKHLAQGVWQGVSDLVVQPAKGAKETGFSGFMSGLSRAVVGLVVKPVVGAVDATTSVVRSVQRSVKKDSAASVRQVGSQPPHMSLPSVQSSSGSSSAARESVPITKSPMLSATPAPVSPSALKLYEHPTVIRVGNWLFGSLDDAHFVFQHRAQPVMVVNKDGIVRSKLLRGQARAEFLADDQRSQTVLTLGAWFVGPSKTKGNLSLFYVFLILVDLIRR